MKGFIDQEQQDRLKAQADELCEDLETNVCIKSDRDFVLRMKNYMSDKTEFVFARQFTVAESDRLASIYGNYVAYVKNRKETKR